MKLYTVQLARHRACARLGVFLLDTTVKSGDPVFAPSWEMVRGFKDGRWSPALYTRHYTARMYESMRKNPERWQAIAALPAVALACYCATGGFCHRHLLVALFERYGRTHGVECTRGGEIV